MQTTAHPLPCEEVPGYNAFADIRFLGSSVTRPLVVTGSLGHWVTVGHCGSLLWDEGLLGARISSLLARRMRGGAGFLFPLQTPSGRLFLCLCWGGSAPWGESPVSCQPPHRDYTTSGRRLIASSNPAVTNLRLHINCGKHSAQQSDQSRSA
jgi:hypothetical protein